MHSEEQEAQEGLSLGYWQDAEPKNIMLTASCRSKLPPDQRAICFLGLIRSSAIHTFEDAQISPRKDCAQCSRSYWCGCSPSRLPILTTREKEGWEEVVSLALPCCRTCEKNTEPQSSLGSHFISDVSLDATV